MSDNTNIMGSYGGRQNSSADLIVGPMGSRQTNMQTTSVINSSTNVGDTIFTLSDPFAGLGLGTTTYAVVGQGSPSLSLNAGAIKLAAFPGYRKNYITVEATSGTGVKLSQTVELNAAASLIGNTQVPLSLAANSASYGVNTTIAVNGLSSGETVIAGTGYTVGADNASIVVNAKVGFAPTVNTPTRSFKPSIAVALPTPLLLEGYESLTGVANVYANAGVISLDTTNKLSGSSSLKFTPSGVPGSGQAVRSTGRFSGDPASLGTIAFAIRVSGVIPDEHNFSTATLYQGATNTTATNLSPGGSSGVSGPGWKWAAASRSDFDANFANLVSGTATDVRVGVGGSAPYAEPINIDAVVARAGGVPTIVLTFDDGYVGQYTRGFPLLKSLGLIGTIYAAPVNYTTKAGYLTVAMLQEMKAAGWGMGLDGRDDDDLVTRSGSVANWISNLQGIQTWLANNNLLDGKGGENHFCYPNGVTCTSGNGGTTDAVDTSISSTSVTSDGSSTTVTLGSAVTLTGTISNLKLYTSSAPNGVSVVSQTDSTHVVLASAIPSGTTYGRFTDSTTPFAFNKAQAAAKAAGFLTGRTTLAAAAPMHTRFGMGDQGLYMPSFGTTGATYASLSAAWATTKARGSTLVIYMHDVVTGDSAGINIGLNALQPFGQDVANDIASGNGASLSIGGLWQRDCANPAVPS